MRVLSEGGRLDRSRPLGSSVAATPALSRADSAEVLARAALCDELACHRDWTALAEAANDLLRFLRENAERTNPQRTDTFDILEIGPIGGYA